MPSILERLILPGATFRSARIKVGEALCRRAPDWLHMATMLRTS